MPEIHLPDGKSLHYLDLNPSSQRVVLLLHGLGATNESWLLQTQALIDAGYRAIAPDAPGFGGSSRLSGRITIAQMASPLVSLLSSLGLGSADVVGLSMGGTLALQLALEHPEYVNHLVLVSTFARLRLWRPLLLPYHAVRIFLVLLFGLRVQASTVARRVFPEEDQEAMRQAFIKEIASAEAGSYRQAMRALAAFDVRGRLGKIQASTLVVSGACDATVPASGQRELLLRIRGAQQVIIGGGGHAVNVDHAEEFNRILLDFLAS
jgi:pimeloyl-ACP methyl ester carboxylesterase